MEPELACKDAAGRKALETSRGFTNSFFAMSDTEFTHSRFPPEVITELGAEKLQEIEKSDFRELVHLRTVALNPGWMTNVRTMDICWYDSTDPAPPEDRGRNEKPGQKANLDPYLRLEAWSILEAIAATIYADKVHGLRFQKCKQCLRLFRVESGHGAAFCPAPAHLKSSPCKNAYFQKKRRDNPKAAG